MKDDDADDLLAQSHKPIEVPWHWIPLTVILVGLAINIAVSSYQPKPIAISSATYSKNQEDQSSRATVLKGTDTDNTSGKSAGNSGDDKPEGDAWTISDKIAVGAVIASVLQFLALLWTIGIMRANGRRELRAYVLQEGGQLYDGTTVEPIMPENFDQPAATLVFKNMGQTPAYKVTSWGDIAVIPIREEATLSIPDVPPKYSTTLGAGNGFPKHFRFKRRLTAEEITGVVRGEVGIYIFGRVTYRDAFKKERFTYFRLIYTARHWPPPKGAQLNFCESGNDAD
jgi:hypothetical protein